MQLPPGNCFVPPDGNRSRFFRSNEKHNFLGISLREQGEPIPSKGFHVIALTVSIN